MAEHHCAVILFLPVVQPVHMFQVNKPGVEITAAVCEAVKSFNISYYELFHIQNRLWLSSLWRISLLTDYSSLCYLMAIL